MKYKALLIGLIVLLLSSVVTGQHRGDMLSFQGLDEKTQGGLEAMAMGGAYTAMSGTIDNLFTNAAGLVSLKKWTISINGNYYKKTWWENQVYRPNRYFVTMPFYLEGYYIPDPKNNGVLDRDLALDSAYVVSPKDQGKFVESKDAADWVKEKSAPVLNNIALAIPFKALNRQFVVAAAYQQSVNFLDYDRNDTYLSPHIGTNIYDGWISRVNGGDTLNVNWYRYLRERTGDLKSVSFALASEITNRLTLGLAIDYTSGKSTDRLQLDKVGYFGLIDENQFFFSYDTLNYQEKGSSDFSTLVARLGFQYHFDNLTVGAEITLPQTLTRKWNYTVSEITPATSNKQTISGKDRFEIPALYSFGMSFRPIESFTFSLNYQYFPYSQGKFKLARNDTTFRKWKTQHTYMFGAQYRMNTLVTVMAGYRWQPSVFVPDGVAYTDRGPEKISYTLGAKFSLGKLGKILAASEFQTLKYHDTYMSNTNYVTEKFQNFSVGYIFEF